MTTGEREKLMLRVFGATEWAECFRRYKDANERVRGWLYRTYIDSTAWFRKRRERLEIDGHRCQGFMCFRTDCLEVHHKTYERIGDERMEDLITLCESCHEIQHGRRRLDEFLVAVLWGGNHA